MTKTVALLQLAERVEKATELQVRALLIDAGEAVLIANGHDADTEETMGWLDRFEALIEAGAYLDAAMQLAPAGASIEINVPARLKPRARVDDEMCHAATPALALCAASLRALASQGNNNV